MKRVLVLTFLLIALMSYSQKGQVNYGFIESLNIGNAIGEDYNAILNFDTNNSEYVTGKINLEKSENLNKQQVFENPNGGGGFISEGLLVTLNGNQVIVDKKANTMLSNIKYGKQIYVKESIPNFKWEIFDNEKKKIGNYECIKAKSSFRGRKYTAWFTNEIPISLGPWKLNGLPGLILEAYDENKNVFWYFKSIKYPINNLEISKILLNDDNKIQNEFLDEAGYSLKLKELVQRANEKSLIFSKQNNVEIDPIKQETVFIENF